MNSVILSILAGLGGMFGWGASDFFASFFSKKFGYFRTFFWAQAAGLVFANLLIFVFGINLSIPGWIAVLLLAGIVFYTVGYLFLYKGFEVGNVVIVATASNLWGASTAVFAFLFLGQRLSIFQFVGVSMITAGVVLTSFRWDKIKEQTLQVFAGVKETVLSALMFGVFWNLSDIITQEIGWLPMTVFTKSGVVLLLLLFSFLAKRPLGLAEAPGKLKLTVVLVGILEAIAIVSVNFGLTVGDVILVAPISSALSVVTIIMAMVFLKEKITKLQGLGIITAIAGIVLTAF